MTIIYSQHVPSQSEKGKKYFVRLSDDARWFCNCPDALMRNRECKHITIAKEHREKQKPTTEKKLSIEQIQERLKKMGQEARTKQLHRTTGIPVRKGKDELLENVQKTLLE